MVEELTDCAHKLGAADDWAERVSRFARLSSARFLAKSSGSGPRPPGLMASCGIVPGETL